MPNPIDNRFSHLIRPSDAEPYHIRKVAVDCSRKIVNRTNIGCAYNDRTGDLYFYLPHDIRCGLPVSLPIWDGRRIRRPSPSDIDDIVRAIGMARLPVAEKNKIEAANQQKEEWRETEAMESRLAERRPEALSRAEHLLKKKQMGKHFRGGAVVNGLKGA